MTGLDQEMMQKNISVRNLKDSQKNVMSFSVIIVFVNLLFLLMGGLLYLYALNNGAAYNGKELVLNGRNIIGDDLFPTIVMSFLPPAVVLIFIIGLISALFPSADGALTALTSSFCVDMLGLKNRDDLNERQKRRIRLFVHLTFTVVFMICILIFKWINEKAIINTILDLAGYTYGPLLGLFAFGILTKRKVNDSILVTVICLLSPVICYYLTKNADRWFGGYQIGIELLLINGIITFLGLFIISKNEGFFCVKSRDLSK